MAFYDAQLCFRATVLPHNAGISDNFSSKSLFKCGSHVPSKITRQEQQQPTDLWTDATDLTHRQRAYRLARLAAMRIGWSLTALGRLQTFVAVCLVGLDATSKLHR